MAILEQHTHFDEETHKYFFNDRRVPSVTEICAPITSSMYGAESPVIKAAAHRGTLIHELCALFDYECLPDEIDETLYPYLRAYIAFLTDYHVRWDYVETRLYSPRFAGTLDRLGKVDGKLMIVDLKTTSSMNRQSLISLAAQLQGYAKLCTLNNFGGIGPDMAASHMGVQLMSDGQYRVHTVKTIEQKYNFNSTVLFDRLLAFNELLKGVK